MQRRDSSAAGRRPHRSSGTPGVWFAVDVAALLVFATSGRSTHERGLSVVGVLETAWPFVVAYACAVVVSRAWRSPSAVRPTGLVLWLVTVIGGLLLRGASGSGVALSFQIVTLLVLGLLLLLPRALVSLAARRRGAGRVA